MQNKSQLSRRTFCRLLAAAGISTGTPIQFPNFPPSSVAHAATLIPYGAAVYLQDLTADSKLREIIFKLCQRITPSSEMKWDVLRPTIDNYNFKPADMIADFARNHGLAIHGHPLVWYASNNPWLDDITEPKAVRKLMADHIGMTVTRYKDVAHSWDVVNEPIPDNVNHPTDRRDAWYYRAGKDAIANAFRLCHEVDPSALLVLNEYDVEFARGKSPMKLRAFRNLILELLDQDAPIGAIGLQGHLRGGWPIAKDELAAFTSEMRGHGLKILITELDVIDQDLPKSYNERDTVIFKQVDEFLAAASEGGSLHSITTWGISDQYSWIRWAYPRDDGTQNRPLPLDWNFKEKPLKLLIDKYRERCQ